MRGLFKNVFMGFFVMALAVGCGKENSSGSSSSKSSAPIDVNGIGSTSQNFQTIEEVRSAFANKSMNEGISEGLDIYHVGTYFGGTSSSGFQASYEFSGCINLIFWQAGDCDGGYGNYLEQQKQQLESAITAGRLLKVSPGDNNSISAQRAIGVNSDLSLQYQNLTLSRNNILDDALSGGTNTVRLEPATITLSDDTTVEGVAIIKGNNVYVLSTNLPIAANPIFVGEGWDNYWQQYSRISYLSKIGPEISVINVQ